MVDGVALWLGCRSLANSAFYSNPCIYIVHGDWDL